MALAAAAATARKVYFMMQGGIAIGPDEGATRGGGGGVARRATRPSCTRAAAQRRIGARFEALVRARGRQLERVGRKSGITRV